VPWPAAGGRTYVVRVIPVESTVALLVGLVVLLVLLALLAERLSVPTAVAFAIGGLALGLLRAWLPGIPSAPLPPNVVLIVLMPPILAAAAYNTSIGQLRANLISITSLAVGLVLVSAAVATGVAHWLMPALPLAALAALGAIVAPPDAAAATAIAGRLGISGRLVAILEGEGMLNDAAALILFEVAVSATVTGKTVSVPAAALEMLLAGAGGVLIGLAAGQLAAAAIRRIDDAVMETIVTVATPYAAYLIATQPGASGVLAVVTACLVLRPQAILTARPSSRMAATSVWAMLNFLSTGLAFLLLGLDLGRIVAHGVGADVLGVAMLVCVAVVVCRFVWVFATGFALIRTDPGAAADTAEVRAGRYPWRAFTVISWAGMRGPISLAAALAVPVVIASGAPFPGRDLIEVTTAVVIVVTLLVQGLTLPWLVRALGQSDPDAPARELATARAAAAAAALAAVDELGRIAGLSESSLVRVRGRLPWCMPSTTSAATAEMACMRDEDGVLRAAIEAERRTVLRLWDSGRIGVEAAQHLQRELDAAALHIGDVLDTVPLPLMSETTTWLAVARSRYEDPPAA